MKCQRRIASLLAAPLIALAAPAVRAESIEQARQLITVGQTVQAEIRQKLGPPQETVAADDVDIWVYHDRLEIPMLVSLIPIIGDIADAIELTHNLGKNQELIIQFDRQRIVRKAKLRDLD